ncbi:MAG: hypothetical protein CVT86_07670 [Alphaproteobacteria bacterium HGW-Alphaproteobacteria-8]|nr:MAG: hypothetical protein CVT86_07670 [Alphaproteobacteria bacterium HGW-Alphaproteobacteria-8]
MYRPRADSAWWRLWNRARQIGTALIVMEMASTMALSKQSRLPLIEMMMQSKRREQSEKIEQGA